MGHRRLGIDIGSTTVKATVLEDEEIIFSIYRRHGSRQAETLLAVLDELPYCEFDSAAVCGSGGKPIAEALGQPFVQEVVANAAAVSSLYHNVRTAIELGGQDAKVVFFNATDKGLQAGDMRMNGICAGGTGAFIDEIAVLLKVPTEGFNELASHGTRVYDISGRCGVFAKTDIQPLLLQGARREDIALSAFHAIAKQTIGGLSQGLELKAPIIFEGGPMTFNPRLVQVFAERLGLRPEEIIIPEHPETIVARGAAIASAKFGSSRVRVSEMKAVLSTYKSPASAFTTKPFFDTPEQREAFVKRHLDSLRNPSEPTAAGKLDVWIGIDSGSTTSKFVLIDSEERVLDRFYANNFGEPLKVLRQGLLDIKKKYAARGIELNVRGLGTTGYGEKMVAAAFGADYHTVETVAHATAALKVRPDASFILDIGGQDMKAIWVEDGIITNIMLNEACSSGCGSFLENFASTLGIPVEKIADAVFESAAPAHLGSRCTVFMNSTIISEQRNGRGEKDLMAGLCRSIIENVFTKVVRLSNVSQLGENIVVQGGTFRNFAVLRALEEYIGKEVTLAPFPGEMGAFGAALLSLRNSVGTSRFIGFDALETFEYESRTGIRCGRCSNNCALTVMRFSTGERFVTGNRCERGSGKEKLGKEAPDLFEWRNAEIFRERSVKPVRALRNIMYGIPRVLEFWDSYPFWQVFLKALGYGVRLSDESNRADYEEGLRFVASDTICFPAKLVHGHIANLARAGVDRIFFPYIMHMPPEGLDKLSPYVCSVVQGYPMVTRNSQNPERTYGIPMDSPVFHFFTEKDWPVQIQTWAVNELGASKEEAAEAFTLAKNELLGFRAALRAKGAEVLSGFGDGRFAVVVAGRPYQCDPLINHNLPQMFSRRGIPVLTVDSLPGLSSQDISNTRVEITNNFHTRMLEAALLCGKTPALEYVQMVSFGCGHDAILSDEIIRIASETGYKPPLVLKIDESDASGSIGIRVQSFIESVLIRRSHSELRKAYTELKNAFPVKYYKSDKQDRILLIPNISEEVSVIMKGVFRKSGFNCKTIPVGGVEQIRVGKRYSHNDICFPCQMVIGELIDEIQKGGYDPSKIAVGMVKFQCDCRMSHYGGLLRKALDAAGLSEVPVVTTDPNDTKNGQPGVRLLGIESVLNAVLAFMMLDILQDLKRKIRPYELTQGETDRVFMECVNMIADSVQVSRHRCVKAFETGIAKMGGIACDRSVLKPRCLVTGELLVTYHPGSNFNIERYLEANGMETVFPRLTDQLRKDFIVSSAEIKEYNANIDKYPIVVSRLFDIIQKKLERIASRHPLYRKACRPAEIYEEVRHIIPKTLSCGEGWLMAAEIAHYAKEGVKSHIILQPFGCLPNHICGRGTIKRLKEDFPDISILPLDLDPDTSYANVENRLQMLIMNNAKKDIL